MCTIRRNLTLIALVCLLIVCGALQPAIADYNDTLSSIENSIEADGTLGTHNFEIIYRQGMVILKGTVASDRDRERVVEIAEGTQGVKSVRDWLTVSPARSSGSAPLARYQMPEAHSDSQIESDIRAAIASDFKSLSNNVTISVDNGVAKLGGDTNSFREVDQLLATTLMVPGVQDILSELTVNGHPYETEKFTR